MNLPLVDHAVLVGALVQIADLRGTHVSETGQTGQTDHTAEKAGGFGPVPGQKLPGAHQKLTSGTGQPDRATRRALHR
jgi:hypothetical protein